MKEGKRSIGLLLTAALVLMNLVSLAPVSASGGAGYRIDGKDTGGGYQVTISAGETDAIGGRIALAWDTEKLALSGPDSFAALDPGPGVSLTTDGVEESALVNRQAGVAGFAWYSFGLSGGEVARFDLTYVNGATAADVDESSIWVRVLPEGFGSWDTSAHLAERTAGVMPNYYDYLTDGSRALDVTFAYDGSDRPSGQPEIAVTCLDAAGAPVAAVMTLDGRTYTADAAGTITVAPARGEHRYRLQAAGYGDKYGTLTAAGQAGQQTVYFTTDAELARLAAQRVAIGYVAGDSAGSVTDTLSLPTRVTVADSGVEIRWSSSDHQYVLPSGLVYRPKAGAPDAEVTLTATAVSGEAQAQQTFTVVVKARQNVPDAPQSAGGSFTDLESVPWAREAIEAMAKLGIIKGTSDSTFSPEENIKRGDFVLLLMRMMSPETTLAGETFQDVAQDSYYHDAIVTARSLGIVEGTGGNTFSPEGPISRQEMAAMVSRALEITGYVAGPKGAGDLGTFTDQDQIADWARESMADMVGRAYLIGSDGRLSPQDHTTRAEAAVFLYRIVQEH